MSQRLHQLLLPRLRLAACLLRAPSAAGRWPSGGGGRLVAAQRAVLQQLLDPPALPGPAGPAGYFRQVRIRVCIRVASESASES
jgi:hypothetical protein